MRGHALRAICARASTCGNDGKAQVDGLFLLGRKYERCTRGGCGAVVTRVFGDAGGSVERPIGRNRISFDMKR